MLVGSDVFHGLRRTGVCLILLFGVGVIPFSWAGENEKTLSLSLITNKSVYTRGEPVELTLTVKNITEHHLLLSFASAKQFDFVVKQGDHELWRWSDGKMFAMVLTRLKLDPQESKQFQVVWPQTDRSGQQLKPGFYEAVGFLELRNNPLSKSVLFEIR